MIDIREGQFVVIPGYSPFTAKAVKADALTPKIIKTARTWGKGFAHTDRASALVAFDTKEEADRLVNTIAGIRGEYDRRVSAAGEAARDQVRRAVEKAQRDSGSGSKSEDAGTAAEAEGPQSGGEAASPTPSIGSTQGDRDG